MPADFLVKQAPPTNGDLRVFSLYVDFPASVRARWMVCTIIKLAGPCWNTTSEMWKTDSLRAGERIRKMITQDAANADVILVAVSSLAQSEPTLIEWLDCLAAEKTRRPVAGLLLGLLGDEETQTGELAGTVKPLIRCAQQTGREFIWHSMREDAMTGADWLTEDLENLLARKLAAAKTNGCL
jgi:hypothetical protein